MNRKGEKMMSVLDPDLCAECGNKFPESQVCDNCRKNADLDYQTVTQQAAVEFLDACSLEPTPDAVDQLVRAFLPCLRIICERGYERNGGSWREQGWRGQLYEMMKRMRRLEFFGWRGRTLHTDSAYDMINYAGFLLRGYADSQEDPWGKFGEPE